MKFVLVGFMGSGKTTVGRLLAERLGVPFADADEEIERAAGRTIPAIFEADGEPAFRELEAAAIARLLDGDAGVLALGGGAMRGATANLVRERAYGGVARRAGRRRLGARAAGQRPPSAGA